MRVGVGRFYLTLCFGQLLTQVHLVVLVAGALRKHVAEEGQIVGQTVPLLVQSGGETLFEIAGGRVERGVERLGERLEDSAVGLRDALADVNEVDSGAGAYFERNFNRCCRHLAETL